MISRRQMIASSSALAALGVSSAARAQGATCAVFDKSSQAATSPDQALARLKEGNERFTTATTAN